MPPIAAAMTIDDATSSSMPALRNCFASTHPATTKAMNIINPNVVISMLPILMSVGYMPRRIPYGRGTRVEPRRRMNRNALSGKTIRWTFDEGPVAGAGEFEHELRPDGKIVWRVGGKSNEEQEYAAMKIADNVYVLSYLSAHGYTLTTVLNTDTNELVGFASGTNDKGEKEWFPLH